ncbi:MAG TPA: LemA family protein [Spirochaetota bacterium]|nr:LemA family protein [Spirochaetota bacterium]
MKKFIPLFVTLGIIIIIVISLIQWYATTYNILVAKEEVVNNAMAQVQNQYQRRMDLIPMLVDVVKGYAKHEKDTLESIIDKRNQATKISITKEVLEDPEAFKKFQQAQSELSGFLTKLMAITESYPNLKANENFLALQSQLEGTENRISVERKRFNDTVSEYNIFVRQFPNNIIAGSSFRPKQMFQADSKADIAPKINF